MGASGAGKSTLLHLLSGLDAADHGSVAAGDFPIDTARPRALAAFRNHNLGFIFQFHHLLHDLTALENVSLPLMIGRTGRREAESRAADLLASAGLADRSGHLLGRLSGGEQQRVAVCRALVNRPSFVFADEPTGNLDEAIGDEIARRILSYAKETGAILILTTHNRRLAALCDRTLTLQEGKLSAA